MPQMNIEIDASEKEKLIKMMAECGFATTKDLFNNALTLLDKVVEQTKEGKVVAFIDQTRETYGELNMPFMKNIRKS